MNVKNYSTFGNLQPILLRHLNKTGKSRAAEVVTDLESARYVTILVFNIFSIIFRCDSHFPLSPQKKKVFIFICQVFVSTLKCI